MNDEPPSVVVTGHAYAVHLPSFDGPLDLLLHLIRKADIDIFDIPLSRLTKAYLQTLEQMRRSGMEPASEFLLMAATLLQIKSRLLLPRPAALDDLEGGEAPDPREELVRQLLEYQRFKEAADALDGLDRLGRDFLLRPAGADRPATDLEEAEMREQDAYRLAEAFRSLLNRGHFEAPHEIYVERVSIAERIAQIADLLATTEKTTFEVLCEGTRYREELITTFLALLEMSRLKLIRTTQQSRLEPLYIEARSGSIGELGEHAAGTLT